MHRNLALGIYTCRLEASEGTASNFHILCWSPLRKVGDRTAGLHTVPFWHGVFVRAVWESLSQSTSACRGERAVSSYALPCLLVTSVPESVTRFGSDFPFELRRNLAVIQQTESNSLKPCLILNFRASMYACRFMTWIIVHHVIHNLGQFFEHADLALFLCTIECTEFCSLSPKGKSH
jgi:hypothetical protein